MTVSEEALARHTEAMRRQGRIYAAVIAAIVIVTAVIVQLVWITGEAHNTTLHTTSNPPATVSMLNPAATLAARWHTSDRLADGVPVWKGTVVTYTKHTVRGRDARTGAITWSYSRSNRVLCYAGEDAGVTVALYQVNGNCDEVTGLNSETGARKWVRTLDMDGRPVNGHPAVAITPYSVMFTTPTVIQNLDVAGGGNRWIYHPKGCTISAAVPGSLGALISQTCSGKQCQNTKFCGDGPQLVFRDAYAGDNDQDKHNNPDQVKWDNLGDSDVPVSADQVVSAINTTTHALDVLNSANGKNLATLTLSPVPATTTGSVALATSDNEVIWLGSTLYAVSTQGAVTWTAPSLGPPTIASSISTDYPLETTASRVTTSGASVQTIGAAAGSVAQTTAIAVPSGGLAYPLGAGFVVGSPSGTVVYS